MLVCVCNGNVAFFVLAPAINKGINIIVRNYILST